MKDIRERMAAITPERRRLLERLLEEKGMQTAAEPAAAVQPAGRAKMTDVLLDVAVGRRDVGFNPEYHQDKAVIQEVYNAYHTQMQGALFDDLSFFMNLGYVATEAPQHARVELPERMVGRQYVKLVLEVFGDADLDGRRVLDVGCGRGGTIHTLHSYRRPALAVGLDLTAGAVGFCRAHHRFPSTWFVRGNAERLPFADASFDAVTNIESSHHYSAITDFYRDVHRVLAPGGRFLYATLLSQEQLARDEALLAGLGFVCRRAQDITPNVLAACNQDRRGVFGSFESGEENPWIANAVSMPGSDTYNFMASGRALYKMYTYEKPA